MSRIAELQTQGQSIWFDYIERGMVQSGELQSLVDEGVTGVTSNPSIFQQAISKSPAYQGDLQTLITEQQETKPIYETLAIADIQAAADILRSVYDKTNAYDGYVSIEVAPDLAYDTDATIEEARRLHAAVDRSNVMVKVPATAEGVAAIRQLISDGININVTLIFGLERYAEVKQAYIQGLSERLAAGKSINKIASVASFFISRVDVNIDAQLGKIGTEEAAQLQGKVAVANAKLAYAQFQQVFAGPEWQTLADAGAMVQRPLWASTSTKNPSYPDLLYVDTLIGPDTVNTMPPATVDAFRDHGTIARTVDQNVAEAQAEIVAVTGLGIDIDMATEELEKEGVQKFIDAFVQLLGAIDEQREKMLVSA